MKHWSDCAVHNGPAMEPGPCDCGGYEAAIDKKQGSSGIGLEGFYTHAIQGELSSREGVSTLRSVSPEDRIVVTINGAVACDRSGPATVTVNID
ncbi:hypothetical protein KGY14_05140 [Ameyamaea chiangmaiensis]|nr:hypothetical protein [Ameyamaea chiangmaiensis]MBS4074573.1 hypothetical protein [Ameyamaea chiangmaiensis]